MESSADARWLKRDVRASVVGLIPFVCFFFLFLALLWPIELRPSSDDTAHFSELQQLGVWGWVRMRAETWQPRITSDLAFAVLVNHLRTWKLLNAGIMSLLLWVITRTALLGEGAAVDSRSTAVAPEDRVRMSRTRFATMAASVPLLWFLIHPNVITSGSVWFTGSFYYLWPTTAMLIGLMPALLALYGKNLPWARALIPVCVVFSLIACFTEQTAAVQAGIMALVLLRLLITRHRLPVAITVQFAAVLVTSALFFYFDFASPRVAQHAELSLFPEFADFSMVDKLVLGINVYTTHLLHVSNILFTVVSLLAGWMAFRRIKSGTGARIGMATPATAQRWRTPVGLLAFLPGAWAVVNTLPLPWGYTQKTSEALGGRPGALGVGMTGWLSYLSGSRPMSAAPTAGAVILSTVAVVCTVTVLWLLWLALPGRADQYLGTVLYLAAFLSGILIGFSASIWASESRPNYISNFLLLLLLSMLLRALLWGNSQTAAEQTLKRDRPVGASEMYWAKLPIAANLMLLALAAFACYVWYLYHSVFATNVYWWY